MNKETYLRILRGRLHYRLTTEEVEDIINYYAEYFADAGEGREQSVIEELGSPERLAQQILGERRKEELAPVPTAANKTPPRYAPEMTEKLPEWAGVLILVLAAIFAGPVVGSLAFGLGLGGVICVTVGVGVAISGIVNLSLAGALFQVGGGLIAAAVGVLLVLGAVVIVWLTVKFVRWFWKSCVKGGSGYEAVY